MSNSVDRQKQLYDEYYSEYFHPAAELEKLMHRRLVIVLKRMLPKHARVLDIGCGNGNVAVPLGSSGRTVTGIDISTSAIATAQQHPNVKYQQVSLEAFADDRPYNAALMFDVIEHMGDPVQSLRTIADILTPGGLLVISTPNMRSGVQRVKQLLGYKYEIAPCHEREYTLPDLKETMTMGGFDVDSVSGMLLGPRRLTRAHWINQLNIWSGAFAPALAQVMLVAGKKRL